ncbi:hypothetical protein PACTADRAFT_1473 [Pachysolen tannophilus NRRL Y-2460]|uniref:tRNA/rRNA methyltransferase SpoU type domain-containing protein n=1 Tax=Pachysolen tannophilus NRRL Y-2460 TaxID=669874 RepID=A0A1E4TYR8_PACTA|nr:hypothetical protein PACTADRAFT_1473 [Pachysolen tannophilus NRRL Y-2460]
MSAAIVSYFSQQQLKDALVDLSLKLEQDPNSSSTLCELFGVVDDKLKQDVLPNVYEYCINVLQGCSFERYGSVLQLITKFNNETLTSKLVSYITLELTRFIESSSINFDLNFKEKLLYKYNNFSVNLENDDLNIELEEIVSLLKFLESAYMVNDILKSTTLDYLCCFYLGINEEKISSVASKILKWRTQSLSQNKEMEPFIWDLILELMESTNEKLNNGYILWLRYLANSDPDLLHNNDFFQNKIIDNTKYWGFLQKGLVSDLHEHRKFSVSILQLLIKSINIDLDNKFMKWDVSQKNAYLNYWQRFITLYEIIGIDTSLHQAQAASNDMINLLSKDSKIKVPFSLALFSIGFKGSMETVRKFTLNLILSIPPDNLNCFGDDHFHFFKNHFLQIAVAASNFFVYENFDKESKCMYKCEYGETFLSFIVNCFKNLNKEGVSMLSLSILEFLTEHTEAYDTSKIYLTLGLLKGLQAKNFQVLDTKHIKLLSKLFESTCTDGDVFDTTLQTSHLRLLLFTVPNLGLVIKSLAQFMQFNDNKGFNADGKVILNENFELFLDYFIVNFDNDLIIQFCKNNSTKLNMQSYLVALLILSNTNLKLISSVVGDILSYKDSDCLLLEITSSGLPFDNLLNEPLISSRLISVFEKALVESECKKNNSLYNQSFVNLVNSKIIFKDQRYFEEINLNSLWQDIVNSIQSDDEEILKLTISKFQFLNEILPKLIYNESAEKIISLENLSWLQEIAFNNQSINFSKNFYKSKDVFVKNFYGILQTYLKIINLNDDKNKSNILQLINKDAPKLDHLGMVSVINVLMDLINDIDDFDDASCLVVLDILTEIWDSLTTERLILKQKALHLSFIKIVFSDFFLKRSIENSVISERLTRIGNQIIERSYAKKSFLPTLFNCISLFQMKTPKVFEKAFWLIEILINAFTFFQTGDASFKLEYVVGEAYDKNFNLNPRDFFYNKVNGDCEVSYRVRIVLILSKIGNEIFMRQIWNHILQNEDNFHLFKPIKRADGFEEWKRVQLLSVLLLTFKFLETDDLFQLTNDEIIPAIFREASPLCRTYLEWMISYTLVKVHRDSEKMKQILSIFEKDIKNLQPSMITSFERIGCLMSKSLTDSETKTNFLSDFLIKFIIPLATSNKSQVRHFSVSTIISIYPVIKAENLQIDSHLLNTLSNIYNSALETDNYVTYRSGDALIWNIISDFTLVGIFGGVLLRLSDREVDFIDESLFYKYSTDLEKKLLKVAIGENDKDLFLSPGSRIVKPGSSLLLDGAKAANIHSDILLQTKSGSWSTVMDLDAEDQQQSSIKRTNLIVIASLVDKIPNLGSICRVCDCLGVGRLTMNDLKIVRHPQFRNVAVTSDKWMPIEEVQIENIVKFMREQKANGYTLIGLEQTDKSVVLNSELKFPDKSLILLGREREGIPGNLLAELDFCVEIKQGGVVRSMNIQTAAAIIIHAYSSQHC